MGFLYAIPAVVLLVIALVTAIALAACGQIYLHRHVVSHHLGTHNAVGGSIFAVAGALYATLLGFMTVVAWQHFEEARQLVVAESDACIDAWHTAVGLPPPVRQRVRSDMLKYASVMVDHEWSAMRRGETDSTAVFIGMDAIDAVGTFEPASTRESNAQVATMQQLTVVHDARQERVGVNGSGVSWFQWLVLIVGAVCITGFCWLFGSRNQITHLVMTSTVVAVVVSILMLLFELEYPFRSDIGVTPAAWVHAIAHLHQMQAGEAPEAR
jgi:hypothetical protein